MAKKSASSLPAGRPAKGDRKDILVRFPQDVLDGVERRMKREGIVSRNDAFLEACVAWGDHEDGARPEIVRSAAPAPPPPSTASKVKTSTPEAPKPGALLKGGKTARGPKITKAPVVAAPRQMVTLGAEPEEAV